MALAKLTEVGNKVPTPAIFILLSPVTLSDCTKKGRRRGIGVGEEEEDEEMKDVIGIVLDDVESLGSVATRQNMICGGPAPAKIIFLISI